MSLFSTRTSSQSRRNKSSLVRFTRRYSTCSVAMGSFELEGANDDHFQRASVAGRRSGAAAAAGVGVFMLIVWGILILGSIFVIWMLIDCLTSSMPANEKILWVLVIIFLHLIGAILYFALKRSGSQGSGVAT